MNRLIIGDCWHGCYDAGWQVEIVPEAFAHPAKFSRALIRRIYEHAFSEGWLRAGNTVVDPFGGVALGGLDAMWNGLHWFGCELEQKFVDLGNRNIIFWQRKYGAKPGFGSALIMRGDSRELAQVIASANLVCSSPPFASSLAVNNTVMGEQPGKAEWRGGTDSAGRMKRDYHKPTSPSQLGAMKEGKAPSLVVSSPPYAAIATGAGGLNTKPGKDGQQSGRNPDSASQSVDQHYGETAGQLSGMPEGAPPQVECVVASPPYAEGLGHGGRPTQGGGKADDKVLDAMQNGYGSTAGQLASMPEGRFEAVVSSPPYETGGHHDHQMDSWNVNKGGHGTRKADAGYGQTSGQVGGDTFWQAAREIVAQCHAILRPGGDPVPDGDNIEFCDCRR